MKYLNLKIILVLIAVCSFANAQAQWNTLLGNPVTTNQVYLGTDGTSTKSLKIKTVETGANAQPIEFYTNNSATPYVVIDVSGNLSVTGTITSNTAINIPSTTTSSYQIGGIPILWHNGNTSDIFVGVGAGIINTTGHWNSFIGSATGNRNTFSGFQAGFHNNTGNDNCYYGYQAGSDSSNISNAVAIGANARVNIDNGFVLGTDKTNVGIHTTTPQYTLEVRGTVAAEQIIILKHDNTTENLIAIIEQQQNEIALLKQQMTTLQATLTAKN